MSNEKKNEEAPGQNKEIEIVVNARPKTIVGRSISYNELVILVYGAISTDPNTIYTITYQKGEEKPEGYVLPDEAVKIKKGMIFNVTSTTRS